MAFLLIVAFLALLVPLFINQVNDLIDALPGYIETVSLRLNEWFGLEISTESLQEEAAGLPNIIIGAGGTILGGVVSVTTGIFSFLFFVTTVALFAFYMVAELPEAAENGPVHDEPRPAAGRVAHLGRRGGEDGRLHLFEADPRPA